VSKVSAKSVVLEVLSAALSVYREALPVKLIVQAASVFDIAENSIRVAIVRLRADGLIESPERGTYSLGPAARAVNHKVHGWRTASARVGQWDGSWIGVFTADLSRTDRPALRRRTQALRLLGFEELKTGLCLRPNNLTIGTEGVRDELISLGLEPSASVFRVDALPDEEEQRARSLWDTSGLETKYEELLRELRGSLERITELPLEDSVREAFLLGRKGIREVVLDPLLPAPLIDESKRHGLLDALGDYSKTGIELWHRFLGLEGAEPVAIAEI
jgi:phenylacetic acid degradation operon negative regulatory protein